MGARGTAAKRAHGPGRSVPVAGTPTCPPGSWTRPPKARGVAEPGECRRSSRRSWRRRGTSSPRGRPGPAGRGPRPVGFVRVSVLDLGHGASWVWRLPGNPSPGGGVFRAVGLVLGHNQAGVCRRAIRMVVPRDGAENSSARPAVRGGDGGDDRGGRDRCRGAQCPGRGGSARRRGRRTGRRASPGAVVGHLDDAGPGGGRPPTLQAGCAARMFARRRLAKTCHMCDSSTVAISLSGASRDLGRSRVRGGGVGDVCGPLSAVGGDGLQGRLAVQAALVFFFVFSLFMRRASSSMQHVAVGQRVGAEDAVLYSSA